MIRVTFLTGNRNIDLILLTFTWCHCNPADTPTSPSTTSISGEHQVDDITSASDGGRQGGADTLASNHNAPIEGAAALLHQSCPVAVRDCQMVVAADGMGLNVKCIELQ